MKAGSAAAARLAERRGGMRVSVCVCVCVRVCDAARV